MEDDGFYDLTLPCTIDAFPAPERLEWLCDRHDLVADALGILEFFQLTGTLFKPAVRLTSGSTSRRKEERKNE